MYRFNYHRPTSLAQAKSILIDNDEAEVIAGGMTLLPIMKMRLAQPTDLVDLSGISNLSGIGDAGNALVIGAMTRHADVAADHHVQSAIPALARLANRIGDPQVRNCGTLGGSISNSDPSADYPAAVLALNAVIETDQRKIAAGDFFTGMFETALDANEILVSVRFQKPIRAAYAKFPNPASRYAVVGVMVAETPDGVRVAVTGAAANAFRATALEEALTADFSASALEGLAVDGSDFNGDLHASPGYRAHLVMVMARRAVVAARRD